MINTRVGLFESDSSAVFITKELAINIHKTTRNKVLKKLIEKSLDKVLITKNLREELKLKIDTLRDNMKKVQKLKKSNAGRKRIDYTPEELEKLSPEELKRHKYKMWQRESRYNRGIVKNKP